MSELPFLAACRGEPVARTPIWIMRQAGRYLPEYRAVRAAVDFLTLCKTPELAARVTLQPVERFDLDAAILFSDILIPAEAFGLRFDFNPGPVLEQPLRDAGTIGRLEARDVREAVPYVFETVRILRRELPPHTALIGFAAAPLTLATYLVEGRGSKSFEHVKRLLYDEPAAAHELLRKIAALTSAYLREQIEAGAQAIQLFDTWAGLFDAATYTEFGLRWTRAVLDDLRPSGAPRIYFALDGCHLLEAIRGCGADVIGVDWRLPLDVASERLGGGFPLQGNLDPAALLAAPSVVERKAREVLERARGLVGHVFNLGHGVLPGTPPENVETLVRTVHEVRPGR